MKKQAIFTIPYSNQIAFRVFSSIIFSFSEEKILSIAPLRLAFLTKLKGKTCLSVRQGTTLKFGKLFGLSILSIVLFSCGDDVYTPKPTGYFRIDLPKRAYKPLDKDCPFSFEIPTYSSTKQNINNPDKPCWFDVIFDDLNASIYLSYIPLDNDLNQRLEDSRTLAFKHTVKAFDIEQQIISYPEKNVWGLIYSIEGNAASHYQFHLTDSTNHFLRGSLYFNNIPNQDSIQPVLDFVKEDITHIFETFEWK